MPTPATPLAYLRLQTQDFAWVTAELLHVADDCCGGKVVSVLEGGYDLAALAASAAAHVREIDGNLISQTRHAF